MPTITVLPHTFIVGQAVWKALIWVNSRKFSGVPPALIMNERLNSSVVTQPRQVPEGIQSVMSFARYS
jgi:hypothetical protein